MERVVVDTNVLVAALLRRSGTNRAVIRACLEGKAVPLFGQALISEYEDVISRDELFRKCSLTRKERWELVAAMASAGEWVQVYYSWTPNLSDEADNHLIELAVAGGAGMIVTNNRRDFVQAELRFPGIRVVSPGEMLRSLR